MTYTITTEIEIAASPETVWAQLTDLGSFPEWNPFMVEASGRVEPGERLQVRMEQPGGPAMTFRPSVTVVQTARRFEWLGHLVVPGLFDGRHRFELEPIRFGTRLVHSEQFTGLLAPLLSRWLDTKTRAGFESMNHALKNRVESAVSDAV